MKFFTAFLALPFRQIWNSEQAQNLPIRIIWDDQGFIDVPWQPPFEIEPPEDPDPDDILTIYKLGAMIEIKDENGVVIDGMSFNISYSVNDFAWSLTGSRQEDSDFLLNKNVTVDINSESWTFRVIQVEKSERFGRPTYNITARGLQSLFGEPHELPITRTETSASLASSLANNLIQPADANITWSGVNPNYPPNSWSFSDKSRIAAIRDLARELGLIILPAKDSTDFEVRFKHEQFSWLWAVAAPAQVLNKSDLLNFTRQRQEIINYTGIYVTSEKFANNALVRRTGTNGDVTLPEITSALIPDGLSAISRGGLALSEANIDLNLSADYFLKDTTVSIPPGEIILIGTEKYYVEAITISVQNLNKRVIQRLTLKGVE